MFTFFIVGRRLDVRLDEVYISSMCYSSASFAPLVTRSLRGSGLMLVRFGVGIACKLVVVSAGETTNAFDLCKVVDVVADCCMMKDRVDHCSS